MYQRLIRTCAPEITRSLNCRVFCQDTQEFARSNLAHRFGLTPSLTMPKRKTIINFTFNGEIRQIIPDFQKLNLEHKYDIDIGMTALAGFICIHGFKKRAKHIPIKCFTNVGETVAKFFITFVICLVETKAAESPHTYYSTYEKKVLSVKKKVVRNSRVFILFSGEERQLPVLQ
ncbi:MAG: hypothetical protein ALMCE001_01170 [Methanocorpusculum sp. MCE]|nr:MAG: hypothetical protein ALMCE001_01170 [Methanocorpusculum sp. MCE]